MSNIIQLDIGTPIDKQYHRFASVGIDGVLNQVEHCRDNQIERFKILDWTMKALSHRYLCFLNSGIVCVRCDKVATHFAIECDIKNWNRSVRENLKTPPVHMNLYMDRGNGQSDLLFTKDHILAKARGGKNHVSNYQTMCTKCNNKKGSSLEWPPIDNLLCLQS